MVALGIHFSMDLLKKLQLFKFVLIVLSIFAIDNCIAHGKDDGKMPRAIEELLDEHEFLLGADLELFFEEGTIDPELQAQIDSYVAETGTGEPRIEPSVIRELTDCTIPPLNLTNPVITDHANWQIFVYCLLDVIPEDELGNDIYPIIREMNEEDDAKDFLKEQVIEYLLKYDDPTFTNTEKLALFEKVFIATKFRRLTEIEYNIAHTILENSDLELLTEFFLLNLKYSKWYEDRFDYSKSPGSALVPYYLYGKILNDNEDPESNVQYQMEGADIYGFHISGLSNNKRTFQDLITLSPNVNMHLQFYISAETQFPKEVVILSHKSGFEISSTSIIINDFYTFEVVENKKDHEQKEKKNNGNGNAYAYGHEIGNRGWGSHSDADDDEVELINLAELLLEGGDEYRLTANYVIPETLNIQLAEIDLGNIGQTWPDGEQLQNNTLHNISWGLNQNGDSPDCETPSMTQTDKVNGHSWQRYVYCILQYSALDTKYGIEYYPLSQFKSAFDYAFQTMNGYMNSDNIIELSYLQIADNIYRTLTFNPLSTADQAIVQTSIDTVGLVGTLNMMLEAWYFSHAYYSYFDYSVENFDVKEWYVMMGELRDPAGNAIGGVDIAIASNADDDGTYENILGQTTTNDGGTFELSYLLSGVFQIRTLYLSVTHPDYAPRQIEISAVKMVSQTIEISPLGVATPDNPGKIVSPTGGVSVNIPVNAVDEEIQFQATDPLITTNIENPEELMAQFEINPSYEFNEPVKIEVTVTNEIRTSLNSNEDNLALFLVEGDNLVLLADSHYDPVTKKMKASTMHFSSFVIGQCGIIQCEVNNMVHPLGELIERQHIEYPTMLPKLKTEFENLLTIGGWSINAASVITLDPGTCDDISCAPVTVSVSQGELNMPASYYHSNVDIRNVRLIDASVTMTANMDVQLEKCARNPLATDPQIRVNAIDSTMANLSANIRFGNVEITYPCYEVTSGCAFFTCASSSIKTECTEPRFDHYAQINVTGYRQAVYKNTEGGGGWILGPTFSNGVLTVDIDPPAHVNEIRRDYLNGLQDELLSRGSDTRRAIETVIERQLNYYVLSDPAFDENNCPVPGAPSVNILSEPAPIVSDIGGEDANGVPYPATTEIDWSSDRNGYYGILINRDCGSIMPEEFIGATTEGETVTTMVSAQELTFDGPNSVNVCIQDPINLAVGQTSNLIRKLYIENICLDKTRTEATYVCQDVDVEVCVDVDIGDAERSGCWCNTPWGRRCCWCTSNCYVDVYQTQCSWTTRDECVWEDQVVHYLECYDEYRF